jgi:hypothetical protein
MVVTSSSKTHFKYESTSMLLRIFQFGPVEQVAVCVCTMLGERMMLLLPIAWCHHTEYAEEAWSCCIPVDPDYEVSGHMPFTSMSIVADKTLGVHRDKNNMKGGVTFVSLNINSPCYDSLPTTTTYLL